MLCSGPLTAVSLHSVMKFMELKTRTVLTYKHLTELIYTTVTIFEHNFDRSTARMGNIVVTTIFQIMKGQLAYMFEMKGRKLS